MNFPATEEPTSQFMPAGLHLLKVVSYKPLTDKEGNLKRDTNGWPGIEITLINQKKETILFSNYYCDKPMNDPIRQTDKKCKSEFLLTKFKQAIGLGSGEATQDQIIGKKLYAPVREVHAVNQKNEPIYGNNGKPLVFNELVKDFYPYVKDEEPPILPGDPLRGEPIGGIFITNKVQLESAGQAAAPQPAAQAQNAKPKDDDDF